MENFSFRVRGFMKFLEFIAIFCAPIFGILFTEDKLNGKDLILKYLRHLVLSNLISIFIVYIFTGSIEMILL